MIDRIRLLEAHRQVRMDLLGERNAAGTWEGRLADSALSTATAVSALSLVERQRRWQDGNQSSALPDGPVSQAIVHGLRWLAKQQNADGGWGDTDLSHSNIATTMLALAAFHLTGIPAESTELLERAERYLVSQGGIKGLRRRYGRDKTFAVPILTNCALAGMVPWRQVSPLPFELATLPQSMYRFLRLPVVSYAIPALVGIGQARFHHSPPLNPITNMIRKRAVEPSLEVLEKMQPESGGYLEAVPLTSFVVMSLASMSRIDHPVVERGIDFLMSTVRGNGAWPIDTNLATWNTTLAINALGTEDLEQDKLVSCVDWLLGCQTKNVHPFTGAEPGGWGWSDLSGAVPDVDDSSGALLALKSVLDSGRLGPDRQEEVIAAAQSGVKWLLNLQNRDGGWPTFCRGWGKLPFDRSGCDLTAHALRALDAWGEIIERGPRNSAMQRGLRYLARTQGSDGSWIPLWFGNQDAPHEENRVYGTAKVLMALKALNRADQAGGVRAQNALLALQNLDGGWGGGILHLEPHETVQRSSVEETALALEALIPLAHTSEIRSSVHQGLDWLLAEIDAKRHRQPSPIGFYFAKLWYYEDLYPLTFTVSALDSAVRTFIPGSDRKLTPAHLTSD